MGKSFDIGLERLAGTGVPDGSGEWRVTSGESVASAGQVGGGGCLGGRPATDGGPYEEQQRQKPALLGETFYLETFGCQMNEHDSEKVAGVPAGGNAGSGEGDFV